MNVTESEFLRLLFQLCPELRPYRDELHRASSFCHGERSQVALAALSVYAADLLQRIHNEPHPSTWWAE